MKQQRVYKFHVFESLNDYGDSRKLGKKPRNYSKAKAISDRLRKIGRKTMVAPVTVVI